MITVELYDPITCATLHRVQLPAVPRAGDEIFYGNPINPAHVAVVAGPIIYTDGVDDVSVPVSVLATGQSG